MSKSWFTLLLILGLMINYVHGVQAQTANPRYDQALAQKLGGDDYGMKMYVLVLLKTGSNNIKDKIFIDSCFAGHLANIHRLVNVHKLVVAGPFGNNDQQYRGLFIFNVATLDEARELLKSDPAVATELLAAELIPWYGSAALPEYLTAADKIWKSKP